MNLTAIIFLQVIILIVLEGLIWFGKSRLQVSWLKAVNELDIFPLLIPIFIGWLAQITAKTNLFVWVLMIWIIVILFMLIWRAFKTAKLSYRQIWILIWRTSDLLLIIMWLAVIIYVLI